MWVCSRRIPFDNSLLYSDHDASDAEWKCVSVHDIEVAAKLVYYGVKLYKTLVPPAE